jgi:hypothetical protein
MNLLGSVLVYICHLILFDLYIGLKHFGISSPDFIHQQHCFVGDAVSSVNKSDRNTCPSIVLLVFTVMSFS